MSIGMVGGERRGDPDARHRWAWPGVGLRAQMVVLVVLLVVCPVLFVSTTTIDLLETRWSAARRAQQALVARLVAEDLAKEIGQIKNILQVTAARLATRPTTEPWDGAGLGSDLRDLEALVPAARFAFIMDADGIVRATSDDLTLGTLIGRHLAERDDFTGAPRSPGPHLSLPFRGPRGPTFAVSQALVDHAGTLRGVLGVTFDVPELARELVAVTSRPDQQVVVIAPPGLILLHPDPARMLTPIEPEIAARLQGLNSAGDVFEARVDREPRLVATSPVQSADWVVLASTPVDTLYAPVRDAVLIAGVNGLLVAAIAALIGLAIARRATKPLVALHDAIVALGAGEQAVRVPVRGPGELRAVAAQFNRMADDLLRYRGALERRVAAQASELAAADAELRMLTYSVAHDLRAPLRAIEGFSRILLKRHADQLDAQGRDYVARVQVASERMSELFDELLRLSGLSRRRLALERVDLSALASAIATDLRTAAPEHAVEFLIADDLVVVGDTYLLRRVLENLLDNAWKYTRGRTPARIELGSSTHQGAPAYFVRDNGVGFDMAYADRLFGAFQRLHTDAEFEGTGIGLATVKRIIHRHGGQVWAEAAVDQGATFYFTLAARQVGDDE